MTTATVYDLVVFSIGNFKRLGSTPQVAYLQCSPPNPASFDPVAWFASKLANINRDNPNPVSTLAITFCDPATYLTLQTYNVTSVANTGNGTCTINIASPSAFLPSLAGAVAFYIQNTPRIIDTTPPIIQPDFLLFNNNSVATASATQLQQAWNAANTN